jgi:hypothetical protein
MRLMLCATLLSVPLAVDPAAFAGTPEIAAITTLHPVAISSGVVPVKVLGKPNGVSIPPDALPFGAPGTEIFHLKLDVDREGRAHGIQVVASEDPSLNDSIVTAVRQFRWHPAQLDHHSISAPVDLTVVLHD